MKYLKIIFLILGFAVLLIGVQSWAARTDLISSKHQPVISNIFLTESATSTISIPKFRVEVKDTEFKAQGYCEAWKRAEGGYLYVTAKGESLVTSSIGCP